MVTATCGTGTAPAQTGGTVVDGTYVLTSAVDYSCGDAATPPLPPAAATAKITGGCLQFIIAESNGDGGTIVATASETVAYSGTSITTTPVCPAAAAASSQTYTATATTFSYLSTAGFLQVFTKQ
jgi:hypothetical protein